MDDELIEFVSSDNMLFGGDSNIDESYYPEILSELLLYINHLKSKDESIGLFDIVMDYSFKKDLDIVQIGDIINSDVYFKSFLEKDCEKNHLIKSTLRLEKDW